MARTYIITGGNAGLGWECARALAVRERSATIVLGCRDLGKGTAAAHRLMERTGHSAIVAQELDLASLASVRSFAGRWEELGFSPLQAIVCNAGLQSVSGLQRTKDGFESTFGVNHLGHFLLVRLMEPYLKHNSRVIFVSSGTHDPAEKTGLPDAKYTTAAQLAHPLPETEDAVTAGRRRYSTSKLCNVMATYGFAEHFKSQGRPIGVLAFDPGMMPGTGLARDYSSFEKLVWKYVMPLLRWFQEGVNSPATSGRNLALLACDPRFDGRTGEYFVGLSAKKSSKDSYDPQKIQDLWETSETFLAGTTKS